MKKMRLISFVYLNIIYFGVYKFNVSKILDDGDLLRLELINFIILLFVWYG